MAASNGAKASAGGARAAGGVGFQAEVFAYWAARAAAEQPVELGIADSARIEAVGCETGLAVDDVALTLGNGGYILVQAKGGMRRVAAGALDLAKAVDQVISAYREGFHGPKPRGVNWRKDRLVIATNERASSTFAELGQVCARLRDQPKRLPLEDAAKSAKELRALRAFVDVITSRWTNTAGSRPSKSELRGLLQVVEVIRLDLSPGGVDRLRAETMLEKLGGQQAFKQLVLEGVRVASDQGWRSAQTLRDLLGVPRESDAIHRDIDRLQEETARTLSRLRGHQKIRMAEGEVALKRRVVSQLIGESDGFLITGAPGVGKSGVIAALADQDTGDKIVLAVDAVPADRALAQVGWNLSADLADVLRGWDGDASATVYLDGLDAHRSGPSWLADLAEDLRDTRWRLVASIRRFELVHSRRWQQAFLGAAIGNTQSLGSDLPNVRHAVIQPFDDDELTEVRAQSSSIAAVLDAADRPLTDLLCNPFNLSLAADLLTAGRGEPVRTVQTQVQLLDQYWLSRVKDGVGGYGRSNAIHVLIERMTAARTLESGIEGLPPQTVDTIEDLVRRGVLEEVPSTRQVRLTRSIRFRHHIVFDFAVAAALLGSSPDALPARLRDEPDFVIFGRPAIDFHLADLWNDDPAHSSFWRTAVDLAGNEQVLAAAAAAVAAIEHIKVPTDVDALLGLAARSPATTAAFVIQLASAIGAAASDKRGRLGEVIGCYDTLIGRLGQAWYSTGSPLATDQAQAIVMLAAQLDGLNPLPRQGEAAVLHAEAVVHLLTSVIDVPATYEWLAPRVLRLIVGAAALRHEAIQLILRCLDSDITSIWGLLYLEPVLARLGQLAAIDVSATATLAAAPFLFDATEERQIPLGPSQIVALTQSWADAHRWLRRVVAQQSWSGFDSVAPIAATETLGTILKHYSSGRTRAFGIAFKDVAGVVGSGRSLELDELDGLPDMVSASVRGLVGRASEGDASQEIATWVARIDHPEAWTSLLEVAAGTPALAWQVRGVILEADGLFANLETRAAAIQLARSLSPTLSASDHYRLERVALELPDSESDPALTQYLQQARDQILVVLDRDHVQDDATRARLDEIEESGQQPPPARGRQRWPVVWETEQESLWEQLGIAPDQVSQQVEQALNRTASAVDSDASSDDLWAAITMGVLALAEPEIPPVLVDRLRYQIAAVLHRLVASDGVATNDPRGQHAVRLLLALEAEQPLPPPLEES